MRGCTGLDCCSRWREVALAYRDGRSVEAVVAVKNDRAGAASCRVGRMLVAEMIRCGDLEPL